MLRTNRNPAFAFVLQIVLEQAHARKCSQHKTQFNVRIESVRNREHRHLSYQRVFDERKRPIRGLWVPNSRYYAQLSILEEGTGANKVRRVPLEGATSPALARNKIEELRVDRRKAQLIGDGTHFDIFSRGYSGPTSTFVSQARCRFRSVLSRVSIFSASSPVNRKLSGSTCSQTPHRLCRRV